MNNLTLNYRDDILYVADTRIQVNADQELSYRSEQLTFNNKFTAIYANNYEIPDEYSGKYIRVSSAYKICEKYGYSKRQYGTQMPVAGYNDRGNIDGITRLAYNIDDVNWDKFYLAQLNPII